jgi:branched-chain amino acid aminotransferase
MNPQRTGPTSPVFETSKSESHKSAGAEPGVRLPAVWLNGQLQESVGPHLSAFDRGLTLSDGVFETMRVHAGRVFRLDRHLARLYHALTVLNIPRAPELRDWVIAALARFGSGHGSMRLTVTRGISGGGVTIPADPHPTVIITVSSPPPFPSSIYERGLRSHIASGRRNERAMTNGLKTLAYSDAVAALLEAQQAGADEALFLDIEGHCSEATSSNLFVCRRGTLVTPPVSCGALPGITRATVLELAAGFGVPCAERIVGPDELISADEAFLTSSLRGLAPLVQVGENRIGTGAPGVLTRRLSDAYTALIERECVSPKP